MRIVPRESRVLGATANGNAMATVSDYGRGRVVFVNAPIERDAFLRAGAFEGDNPNPLYLVYREAARIAGVRRVVEKLDAPCVGFTEHPVGDGRTVVVAVNHEPREVDCPVQIHGTLGRVWCGAVSADRIVLPANDAAVFEVV